MSRQMMDPPFCSKLCHNRINKGESSFSVPPGFKQLIMIVPFYLTTNGIALNFIEIRGVSGGQVKEFPPIHLSLQGARRARMALSLSVNSLYLLIKESGTETAEFHVGTQHCCAWGQAVRASFWLLKKSYPLFALHILIQPSQSLCLTSWVQ